MDSDSAKNNSNSRKRARIPERRMPTTFVRKTMATDDGYPRNFLRPNREARMDRLYRSRKIRRRWLGMLDHGDRCSKRRLRCDAGAVPVLVGARSRPHSKSALREVNSNGSPRIAEGRSIGTVAVVENVGAYASVIRAISTRSQRRAAEDGVSTAPKCSCRTPHVADFIVVAAKHDSDIFLFVVDTKSPGVSIRPLKNPIHAPVSSVELKNTPPIG